jgi:hypothetical protein
MTVHHGQIFKEESFGSTFEDCLDKLEKTRLYIGYGPKLRDSMLELQHRKFLESGWADFTFEE